MVTSVCRLSRRQLATVFVLAVTAFMLVPTVQGQAASTMMAPASGAKLAGSTVTFSWSAGSQVQAYQLMLGTQDGLSDLYYVNSATQLSATVVNLPQTSQLLYARLWSKVNGAWQMNRYTYIAAGPAPAEMVSPVPGVQLAKTATTFHWSAGYGATGYTLCLGTASGLCDVYTWSGAGLTATVSTIPANGGTLYATLSTQYGSTSQNLYYQYVEPGTPQVYAQVVPDHGTGLSRNFRFVYDWGAGPNPYRYFDVRFGSSSADATTCALTYDSLANTIRFAGQSTGYTLGGTRASVSNGNCTISPLLSRSAQSNPRMLLVLNMQFTARGTAMSEFTRGWWGASPIATPTSFSTWEQVGSWTAAPESWPVVDTSKYALPSQIARQAYVTYGYNYKNYLETYTPLGTHFNAQNDYASFENGYPLDASGFPIPYGPEYDMVTLAEYTLCRWARYITGAEPNTFFVAGADKLLSLVQPDGSMVYLFSAVGQTPPWTSGMAQGLTLGVFARAYSLTKDIKYLHAGNLVLEHMVALKANAGDRSDLGDVAPSLNGYVMIEEAPKSPWAPHVLNGFEFAALGTYDWWQVTGDLRGEAYFESAVDTLVKCLPLWDIGGWTNYDLDYLIQGDRDLDPAAVEYQAWHIALQDALGQITGDPRFYAYRDRWIGQTLERPTITLPSPVSVTPDSGAGSGAAFQFQFQSPGGLSQMGQVSAWFNTSVNSPGGCLLTYAYATKQVTLQGQTATVTGLAGAPGTLSVAECSLNLAATTAVTTSTRLLLNAPITFSTVLTGSKYVYLAALNAANVPSASYSFASYGTWNVCSTTCPAENLLSTQHAVNLGTVGLGSTSSLSVVISNPNATTATLGKIATSNAAFTQTNTCPVALAPNVHCTVTITFSPQASGAVSATLTIPHGLAAGSLIVSLSGTGTTAALTASPNPLNFGYSIVGQSMAQAITVSNYTQSTIDITGVDLTGATFTDQDKCTGQVLAPGGSCTLVVTAVPATTGTGTGSVAIISPQGSVSVPLSVTGVLP